VVIVRARWKTYEYILLENDDRARRSNDGRTQMRVNNISKLQNSNSKRGNPTTQSNIGTTVASSF
jgi:hypothetical protein